jgi:hypothetical protein
VTAKFGAAICTVAREVVFAYALEIGKALGVPLYLLIPIANYVADTARPLGC